MRVEYHPDTVDDLNNAIDYYESRRSGLGSEFRQEIYQTIDRIAADPYLFRTVSGEVRRCFVHRFPFSILYRIVDDDILRVLVVRHHRQHPRFGVARS